jgi:hypothetical protein
MFFVLVGAKSVSYAQSSPVLFFCERYDEYRGEIGVSDRFTKGYLTIMVKADKPLGLKDVHIQFDKYDCDAGKFNFYKKFDFTVDPGMKYIYFSKNESSDLRFDEVGFYRVFLLDNNNETVSSSLIEIIE